MKSNKTFIVFLFLLFNSSCNTRDESSTSSLFSKDIPENRLSLSDVSMYENALKKTGMKDIRDGVEGVVLRFWMSTDTTGIENVLMLEKKAGIWVGYFKQVDYYSNTLKSDSISPLLQTKVMPFSGWKSIDSSLNTVSFELLSDYSRIPDYSLAMDSKGITIEYADSTLYKIVSYPDIELNVNKHADVAKINLLMKYLKGEFGF